jgi:hypothetical protein
MPATFSMSAGKKWLAEPSVAPALIWPGRAFASPRSSRQLGHLVFGLAVSTDDEGGPQCGATGATDRQCVRWPTRAAWSARWSTRERPRIMGGVKSGV